MTTTSPPRRPGLDLRLLGPALVVWAVSWVTPLLAGWWSVTAGAVLVGGSAVVALSRTVSVRRRLAGLGLLLAGASALGVGLRVEVLTGQPWTSSHATAHFAGVVASDPKLSRVAGWAGRPELQVSLDLQVERVEQGGRVSLARVPVRVVGYGDEWAALSWGQRVSFDGRVLPRGRADPYAGVVVARGPPLVVAAAPRILGWTEVVRGRLAAAVGGLPNDARGLLPALVVGDTTQVPADLTVAMRVSGLAHVTAVSGANVVLLLTAMLGVARWIGLRGWGLPACALVTVVGFVLVARPDPSVLRAAVMGLVGVAAVAGAGRRSGPAALLGAVLVLLLLDPWLARSWGFALSVAATAGLLLLSPVAGRRLPRRGPQAWRDAVAVALSAQLATAPLIAALSGRVSVLGVVANLLAAPAVGPATVLGVLVAVTATVWMGLAHALAWVAAAPVWWIASVARTVAGLPDASWRWPHGVGGAGALIVLGVVAVVGGSRVVRLPRSMRVLCAFVLVAAAGVVALGPGRWPPPGWLFVACDVGQGDALVLPVARGSAVVVDAGPDPVLIDQCLHRLGVHRVPAVVLSHFHADHVEGLPGVLRGREVGEIVVAPLDDPPEEVARVTAWATADDVAIRRAAAGESDAVGAVTWQFVWPTHLLLGEGSDPNNNSLVMRVTSGGFALLLTGDVEAAAQSAMVASGVDLTADALKVPHHGSAAQDPRFLAATGAGVAVISVGAGNSYGHPAAATLGLLAADRMVVRRTDLAGDVAVVAGSDGLRVVTHQP